MGLGFALCWGFEIGFGLVMGHVQWSRHCFSQGNTASTVVTHPLQTLQLKPIK